MSTGQVIDLTEQLQKNGATDKPISQKIPGMAPNFGREAFPHVVTFQGILSTLSKVYRASDEALKDSFDNARFMRNDLVIMECLEARRRSTALLDWHLEPEDETDSRQKELAGKLTKLIERIPRFMQYRESLMDGIWYGRMANKHRIRWQPVYGKMQRVIDRWEPVHGDKLVWRFDDGSGEYDPDAVGIRVGLGYSAGNTIAGRWMVEEVRSRIIPTDYGLAYFLPARDRPLIAIHKHMIEDGEYDDPISAGRIHGVGIRHRIYWCWYQKQEALAWLMEYLERSAFGIEFWYYPWGNDQAREKTRQAAQERIGQGRNIVLVPRPVGENSQAYGVERIEPGMGGAEAVMNVITNYFGHLMKRYILGQVLTSEAEATGLGSGVADLHLDTYMQIIRYDATNLEETITTEVVDVLKAFNYPKWRTVPVRFKIDTESPDVEKKLEAWERAYQMGVKLKAQSVMDLIGAAKPDIGDEVLDKNAQEQAAQSAAGGFGGLGQQPPGANGNGKSFPAADFGQGEAEYKADPSAPRRLVAVGNTWVPEETYQAMQLAKRVTQMQAQAKALGQEPEPAPPLNPDTRLAPQADTGERQKIELDEGTDKVEPAAVGRDHRNLEELRPPAAGNNLNQDLREQFAKAFGAKWSEKKHPRARGGEFTTKALGQEPTGKGWEAFRPKPVKPVVDLAGWDALGQNEQHKPLAGQLSLFENEPKRKDVDVLQKALFGAPRRYGRLSEVYPDDDESPLRYAKRLGQGPAAGQRGLWDESEHPRDDEGQFTDKGSGQKAYKASELSKHERQAMIRHHLGGPEAHRTETHTTAASTINALFRKGLMDRDGLTAAGKKLAKELGDADLEGAIEDRAEASAAGPKPKASKPPSDTPQASAAIASVEDFLANPNLKKASPKWLAGAVAGDYLRKMNPMEAGPVCRWLADEHPELAHEIYTTYPERWEGEKPGITRFREELGRGPEREAQKPKPAESKKPKGLPDWWKPVEVPHADVDAEKLHFLLNVGIHGRQKEDPNVTRSDIQRALRTTQRLFGKPLMNLREARSKMDELRKEQHKAKLRTIRLRGGPPGMTPSRTKKVKEFLGQQGFSEIQTKQDHADKLHITASHPGSWTSREIRSAVDKFLSRFGNPPYDFAIDHQQTGTGKIEFRLDSMTFGEENWQEGLEEPRDPGSDAPQRYSRSARYPDDDEAEVLRYSSSWREQDHPRDDQGKWTSGGGAAGAAVAEKTKAQPKPKRKSLSMDLGAIGASAIELHRVNAALEQTETYAVKQYTIDPAMTVGQDYLLKGRPSALGAEQREDAAALAAAIDKSTWDRRIPLYRGLTLEDPEADIARFEAHLGRSIEMDGFQSASLEPSRAASFSDQPRTRGGGLILQIHTEKALNVAPLSYHAHEREVLLGHGWRYKVKAVDRDVQIEGREWTRTVVTLEVSATPKLTFEERAA